VAACSSRRNRRRPCCCPASNPEVVAEQQNRVEPLPFGKCCGKRSDSHIAEAAAAGHLGRQGRNVHPDNLEAAALKMKTDPACAATEIKDTPAHEAHRAPLLRPPVPKRRHVVTRIVREYAAIVSLNDLDHLLAVTEIQ
jgi:hypothetical protein